MELEKSIEKYKALFEGKNKELQQFTYMVSHDLQTPLRNILLFADLLEMDKEASAETTAEYVTYIKESALQASTQIKTLLNYSRLGQGKEFKPTDLQLILAQVQQDLSGKIGESHAIIVAHPLPVINCLPDEMKMVFHHLIDNALKFNKPFGVPRLEISCEDLSDAWKFYFKDRGIGIQQAQFEKIFLIFQRCNPREKYEGEGIGLAFAKKIIELHEGQIWVTSEFGQGSEIIFTINKFL